MMANPVQPPLHAYVCPRCGHESALTGRKGKPVCGRGHRLTDMVPKGPKEESR